MSSDDTRYFGAIFEEIRGDMKVVLEGVAPMPQLVNDVAQLKSDVTDIKAEIITIKAVLTDQGRDIQRHERLHKSHDKRLKILEAA